MGEFTVPSVPADLYPHLNEIAERLCSGHAAVIIGSGFSRNAKPQGQSHSDIPDWSQLGDRLYEKLHGRRPDDGNRYQNVPVLAHEVEATFDRGVLERILREFIPDRDIEPSDLHVKLLELPWSDVFTTNYDTLLERTNSTITQRQYDVVVDQKDLVYSSKPRIVKLHGSFRSASSLVITDKDYRRYSVDYALFENTVRQALVENTMCLIGFSGDDPNFLTWIDSISNNLGCQHSPKMYLVGAYQLSVSHRRRLEQLNIVPLDMSKCNDVESGDHYAALEFFFRYLNAQTQEYNSQKSADRVVTDTYLDVQTQGYNRCNWPTDNYTEPTDDRMEETNQVSNLVTAWKEQRYSFPGWVIVPEERRRYLWMITSKWVSNLPDPDSQPRFLDLEYAFELLWRQEKCLFPIFDNQIGFFEATLDRYLVFANATAPPELHSEDQKDLAARQLTHNDIRNMCHFLLLALMRFYREEGQLDPWNSVCEKIHSCLAVMSPEHQARFYYERVLCALFELNLQDVKKRLEEWSIDDSLPFWSAKKAGLLAEIGQLGDAERILENSLKVIRSKSNLKPITTDYTLVSQESFVMLLLQTVQFSLTWGNFSQRREVQRKSTERWHTLQQYECDPWKELKVFEFLLDRLPVNRSNVTETLTFDIGQRTRTRHFGQDTEALTAYNFLRFCEDAGIPFRIPQTSLATKSAVGTLSRIALYSPYWAMATLVRTGDSKVVDRIFDRLSLARMTMAHIDNLVERYLKSLELAITDIGAGNRFWDSNFGIQLAQIIPEILSRLCCKCSTELKRRLVEFLLRVYQSDARSNYSGIRNLTQRLLEACSVRQRIQLIPQLLSFPILSDLQPIEQTEYINPCFFLDLKRDWISNRPNVSHINLDLLIERAASDDQDVRQWALISLGTLHNLGFLDTEYHDKLVRVLWSQRDDVGLPSGTIYYRAGFLTLPHPTEFDPIELFKQYVRDAPFPDQTTFSYPDWTVWDEIQLADRHLEWSDNDAQFIVNRLIEWWDVNQEPMNRMEVVDSFGYLEDCKKRCAKLVQTLATVITHRFNPVDSNTTGMSLRRIVDEMSAYGLSAFSLEVACLHMFPESRDDILQRIEAALTSSIRETVIDALTVVRFVSDRIESEHADQDSQALIRLLGVTSQILRWRKEPGLPSAINIMADITSKHPWVFTRDIEKSVIEGLCHMIDETAMRAPGNPSQNTEGENREVFTKLVVRRSAAKLAYSLSRHYAKEKAPVPQVIAKWESICQSDDEFAEIRNGWIVPSSA